MRHILVLAELNANKLGSSEEFDTFLARELGRRGDVCYLGFIAEPAPVVREMFGNAGARIADIFRGQSTSARIIDLYRFIKKERIDLVHINFYCLTNPYLLGVYLSGARIVFTERMSGVPPVRGPLKNIISKAIHFFILRRIARYVAVSDYVRDRLGVSHHVSRDKSLTIYNGVNIGRFVQRDKSEARNRAALPEGAKIVASVAMLIPEKGINYLVEAAGILVNEYKIKELCVIMIGAGPELGALEKLAGKLGVGDNVRFMGRRSDVDTLLAAADVVAVPSVWAEAFGLIVAEAMAAGRPVVASRIGGIPELVDDRRTGILVESCDSRGLADGLRELLENPELAMEYAENAREKARAQFNLEHQAVKYADLFEEVLRG